MIKNKRIKKILEDWQFLFDGSLRGASLRLAMLSFKQVLKSEKLTIFDGQIDMNQALPRFPSKYFSRGLLYLKELKKGNWPRLNFFLSVTDRCSSNCVYCYNNSGLNQKKDFTELSFDKIKEVFAYFKKHEPTVFQSCITGGEPMLREDIIDIVRESAKDFFTFLNTSGVGFTEEKARQLKAAGLGILKVSLDDFDRDFVNKRRGNPAAFDSAVAAIKYSVKSGLYTSVGVVASRRLLNEKIFFDFINFLESLGARDLRLYDYKHSGRGSDGEFFSGEERKKLGEYQITVNKNKKLKIKMMSMPLVESAEWFGCNAGIRYVCINANGNVSPCPYLTLSLGNINQEPLEVIIARLGNCLPAPRRFCATNYLANKGADLNDLGLDANIEKNCELLKSVPATDLPDIYKKIL